MIDFLVGVFVLVALAALLVLAFRVSGLVHVGKGKTYTVSADFDNIGGLKSRASVRISGVLIGRVTSISLDPKTYQAKVVMSIDDQFNQIPTDSSASIYTEGLLGANYISVTPGFDNTMWKQGSVVQSTHSAMILENLIGQFLFSMKGGDKKTPVTPVSSGISKQATTNKTEEAQPAEVVGANTDSEAVTVVAPPASN